MIDISVLGALVIKLPPRMVISEPIQPMTPRYITRIEVAISHARASPKFCTRSWVVIICKLSVKNMQALTNVNISRAMPMPNTVVPERVFLSFKFLNMFRWYLPVCIECYDLILTFRNTEQNPS